MGLSVNHYLVLQQKEGLASSSKEVAHYNELLYGASQKLGAKNMQQGGKDICSILAKDPNSTVDDVVAMFQKAQQKHGDKTPEFISRFKSALQQIPDYKNKTLSTEDLNALMDIYDSTGAGTTGSSMAAKELTKVFIQKAQEYLNTPKTSQDERDTIKDHQEGITKEYESARAVFDSNAAQAAFIINSNIGKTIDLFNRQ